MFRHELQITGIRQQVRNRFLARPSLDHVKMFDRARVKAECAYPINGICWKGDNLPAVQQSDGMRERVRIGGW
jgi:hypothetical protein